MKLDNGEFKKFSENPESVNISQVWKTLEKMSPKQEATLPTAKSNHKGKIVTGPSEIKSLLAKEYKERLRTRPIRPDLGNLRNRMHF